jgi:hypothetical protein
MKLDATELRNNVWAVRPEGVLGMTGWINGKPWETTFVKARTREEAIQKVTGGGNYEE